MPTRPALVLLVLGATLGAILLALGALVGIGYLRIKSMDAAAAGPPTAAQNPSIGPQPASRPTPAPDRPADATAAAPVVAAPSRPPSTRPAPSPPPILLTATGAELHGTDLRLESEAEGDAEKHIGAWHTSTDFLLWWVNPPAPRRYRVELTCSCAPSDGGVFLLAAGDPPASTLIGPIDPTSDWQTYRTLQPGTLALPAGRTPITLRPAEPLRDGKALMNLRSIKLTPVDE